MYCVLAHVVFELCTFKDGYMSNINISGARFVTVKFDGTWAANLMLIEPPSLMGCTYTMGGATREEVEYAEERFFSALVGHPLGKLAQNV